jgi:PBP1b-binding outer membrane lipoprotein LpoB
MRHIVLPLVLAFLLVGCSANQPTPSDPVEVTPEMRQFVLSEYQHVVKDLIPTPTTAVFDGEPTVIANRSSGRIELSATGHVHAQNEYGASLEHLYNLGWTEDGSGGWRLEHQYVRTTR